MSTYRLAKVFAPRSIALIGASPREASVGRKIFRNLRDGEFPGPIHLVSSHHVEIDGTPTVPALDQISEAPDLVVLATPAPSVPELVASAGARGCAGAVVITAGLGHGPGSLAENAAQAAREHGLRLIGPHCLGVRSEERRVGKECRY